VNKMSSEKGHGAEIWRQVAVAAAESGFRPGWKRQVSADFNTSIGNVHRWTRWYKDQINRLSSLGMDVSEIAHELRISSSVVVALAGSATDERMGEERIATEKEVNSICTTLNEEEVNSICRTLNEKLDLIRAIIENMEIDLKRPTPKQSKPLRQDQSSLSSRREMPDAIMLSWVKSRFGEVQSEIDDLTRRLRSTDWAPSEVPALAETMARANADHHRLFDVHNRIIELGDDVPQYSERTHAAFKDAQEKYDIPIRPRNVRRL
jgi:hypothetical protein